MGDDNSTSLKVSYSGSGYRGPDEILVPAVRTGESLLDHCEAQGMKLPFGCRAGSCGVCRVEIVEGLELIEAPGFVEEDTLARCNDGPEVRLGCQAKLKVGAHGLLRLRRAKEVQIAD